MDGMTLLEEARSAGLTVRAEDGRLVVRGPKRAGDLAQRLLANKDQILAALDRPDRPNRPAPPAQAEAERLLAELRSQVEDVRHKEFFGTLPAELANVLDDALAIGEGYIRDHEAAAARGWDALELLRGLQGHVRRCVENWKQMRPARAG
jgi:hypothetical protein